MMFQVRTNPALLAASGYVFCYPCLRAHLDLHSHCPVTLEPATQDQIWKIYQDG
jgi:peroxin-12